MRNSVRILLNEAQKKMSGYAALMCYQLANICVKADPMALLEVKLSSASGDLNLEEVAQVALPNDYQFIIIPNDEKLLFSIGQAVLKVHPEFKLEEREGLDDLLDEKERQEMEEEKRNIGDTGSDEDDMHVLRCTMPEINKDRRDVCMEAVKAICEETDGKIQYNFGLYTQRITAQLAGAKAEELDEAKQALEEVYNQHKDICKEYRTNKEKDIEEAYQKYLSQQQEQQQQQQEQQAAEGDQTIQSMVMGGDDE